MEDSYWTGWDLANQGLWQDRFKSVCPCCASPEPETRAHILLHCLAFEESRRFLLPSIQVAKRLMRLQGGDPEVVTLLLGGHALVTARKGPSTYTVSLGSYSTTHLPRVLRFLQVMAKIRHILLGRQDLRQRREPEPLDRIGNWGGT